MASSSTETAFEIRQEIEALFRWNPPRLQLVPPGKKASIHTRPSAFYNKHFDERLKLRRVKRLPSLVQDLAINVDRALEAASKTLPPIDGICAWTADHRERDLRHYPPVVVDEKGVTDYYDQFTAKYCIPVASTLALHPKASMSEWRPLLRWTQSVSSSRYAIMDGELQIARRAVEDDGRLKDDGHLEAIMNTIETETRRIFEEMRESCSSLGTWEIKSIAVGSTEVMKAVGTLSKFPWTTCSEVLCPTLSKHEKQREAVRETKVGVDARDPPWNLNVCSFAPKLVDRY